MPQTIATALPILAWLMSTAGSGAAAYWLLNAARAYLAKPATPTARCLHSFLYRPRNARYVALGLAAAISIAATGLHAALTGQDVPGALDAALAASISAIVSQLMHAHTLTNDLPENRTP